MPSTVSKTFDAVGVSSLLTVKPEQSVIYSATADTFVGIGYFERSKNQGQTWELIEAATDASMTGGTVVNEEKADTWYRFRVVQNGESAVSGTLACSVADVVDVLDRYENPAGEAVFTITDEGIETPKLTPDEVYRPGRQIVLNASGLGKVGATAGWTVDNAANTALALCPASQTAATLVIPIPTLNVGDVITGFHLVGQIESAGATATLDADLRKQTAAAADVTDASVGAITQVSVMADTALSSANSAKTGLAETVAADESFYLLVTGTTDALTDIALMGAVLTVTEH